MANKWFGFRVPGKIVWSQQECNRLSKIRSIGPAVSRLFIWEDNGRERGVVMVLDKAGINPDDSERSCAWKLPTETVDPIDTPLSTAEDIGKRELNLPGRTVQVEKEPVLVNYTKNGMGQTLAHFLFNARLEDFTEISKDISDEDGEVIKAAIIDPYSIVVPEQGKPYFMLDGERQEIFPSHVGYIAWGHKLMNRVAIPRYR